MVDTPNKKEILTAKLQPQRVLASLIPRTEIIRELNNFGQHPKLTVVVAPAGYGKSTLMNQLMECRENFGEIVSWLSLDSNDNDLSTFSNYVLYSYSEAISHRSNLQKLPPLIDLPNASPKERLTLLFNEIASFGQPATMIFDDFHAITNPKLFDYVGWLLDVMPNNLSLIIGSRTVPEIDQIHTLRAKFDLLEINSSRIKFSLAECRDYFLCNSESRLSEHTIELLYAKTEGWIAALQLTMLALREEENPDLFVKEFSGTDRDIVNYLGSCVISQLTDVEKNIMLRTSVLDRLNGELCTLLTGDPNAASLISKQEKTGSFVFSLDRSGKWFRYHQLFRELLLSELLADQPESYSELCLKAAQWFENSGHIIEAIGYYLKAKHYEAATDLIGQHAISQVQYRGQHETLFGWVRELPEEHLFRNATILVCYIWSLTFTHQFKQAQRVITRFNALLAERADNPFSLEEQQYLDYSLEMLDPMGDIFSGHKMIARKKSALWLEKWKNPPFFEHASVLGILSAACLHTLEFELCRHSLAESSRKFYAHDADYGVSWMDSLYAIVCIRQGFINEAREILEKSLQQATQTMGEHSYSSAMISLELGQVYYELNRIDEAEKLIDKGFLYIEDHGFPDTSIAGYVIKSRLLLNRGKPDQALAILIDGERFGRKNNIHNFEPILALERGHLLIKLDNLESAQSLLNNFDFCNQNEDQRGNSPYEEILIETFRIRLLIAQQEYEGALEPIKKLIAKCRAKEVNSTLLVVLILYAKILQNTNQELKALRNLENAIDIAAKENHIRVFIDEFKNVETLLPKLIERRTSNAQSRTKSTDRFIANLCKETGLEATINKAKSGLESDVERRCEKLTKREREILKQLGVGLSSQKLADSMYISLPTLKWHLSNIYGKLGVKNKIQAIKIAGDFSSI